MSIKHPILEIRISVSPPFRQPQTTLPWFGFRKGWIGELWLNTNTLNKVMELVGVGSAINGAYPV